ncbi:MAG: rod shape-determining protein MreC [Candidatus Marinimicrobia bacterium]|nr:rod shape-determining protein MreC [Candidatus Neomarinimicrobiota bacterium]
MIFGNILLPVKEPVLWFEKQVEAKKENHILMNQITALNIEVSKFASLSEENERLQKMLDFKQSSKFNLLPSLVLSTGLQNTRNGFLLNRGEIDSVKINDPIINVDGIVGKIFYVGTEASLGQTLAEPNARISVRIQPSGARGILQWYGGNNFLIKNIPETMLVKKGNLVVSSGYSDIYPPNIPVGIVSKTEAAADGFTCTIYGNMLVDFNRLEEVLIIRENKRNLQLLESNNRFTDDKQ